MKLTEPTARGEGGVLINSRTTDVIGREFVRSCGNVVVQRKYDARIAARMRSESATLDL